NHSVHCEWSAHWVDRRRNRRLLLEIIDSMRRGLLVLRSVLVIPLLLAGCDASSHSASAPILLFAGAGTSTGDVAAVEHVLAGNNLQYATATSQQLNNMSVAQLMTYRVVL